MKGCKGHMKGCKGYMKGCKGYMKWLYMGVNLAKGVKDKVGHSAK